MVNITGPINALSYGNVTFEITKSLQKKTKVALHSINMRYDRQVQDVMESIENSKFPDFNAPSISIWHQNDMTHFVGKGPHIGFPIFELDTFSDQEAYHLSHGCDALFVCSNWAKQVCEQAKNLSDFIKKDIHVVPLGVDTSIFSPEEPIRTENFPFVFFNIGKWEVRKGHDILIKAFKAAFPTEKDVWLALLTNNPFNTTEENQRWYRLIGNDERIHVVEKMNTQYDVASFIKSCHVGVFPTRAEGWGLPILESMACGRRVITTNYSGQTEFCNESNSVLIEASELEPAYDGKWFFGQGNWLKFTDSMFSDLVESMRAEYKAGTRYNKGGVDTANVFTWDNSAERLLNGIEES